MDVAAAVATLLSPAAAVDPYPAYAALRSAGPVVGHGGAWFVSGYEQADAILRDPGMRAYDSTLLDQHFDDWRDNRGVALFVDSMLRKNPPDHTRMRRLAAGVFTARRVGRLRPVIEAQVAAGLDELAAHARDGVVDVMTRLAYPLPIAVICVLLGVPPADRADFRRLAEALTAVLEVRFGAAEAAAAHAAAKELEAYFAALIAVRRQEPQDDLVTALAAAHAADGETLTAGELMGNLALLLVAGFETTTNLIGNGVRLLLQHPAHAARLRADPGLAPGFVEEILRYDPPVQLTERFAGSDRVLAGVPVPAGGELILLLGAANRDPRRFPGPDRFDPDRPGNAPLSFGAGAHYCLGAPLARLEAQVALPALLRRFPELAAAAEPHRRDRANLRGWAAQPVALGAAAATSVEWAG
ncbi:cytochrome P450 [Actinoplanes sp. N902-109]|uniref:cytochrome P450 n=1 Tax=Actinoplanes sp. (strain N902-109) TaxID=649831 RepID=UPI0003294832|nr:cytochrome P450 [Actinoplanes sp. N902-109]AGL19427.1 cytochrome P450 [Actinoplanes sp. N902-109]